VQRSRSFGVAANLIEAFLHFARLASGWRVGGGEMESLTAMCVVDVATQKGSYLSTIASENADAILSPQPSRTFSAIA
jgi:hypothetical protein